MRSFLGLIVIALAVLAVGLATGIIAPTDSLLGVSAADVGHGVRSLVEKAFP